ncbi:uncharacterized protein [Paramormyrops kingsleyae]|uniref:uncharacterized protein n=1 Tax=Paramormyrops kingsleyae TaxID=1676925 RepID=UPI003B97BA81
MFKCESFIMSDAQSESPPSLKSKGKIYIEEEKTEILSLKKVTRISKGKEEEQEVVTLRKVPLAPADEIPKTSTLTEKEATREVTFTKTFEVSKTPKMAAKIPSREAKEVIEEVQIEELKEATTIDVTMVSKVHLAKIPTDEKEKGEVGLKKSVKVAEEETPKEPSLTMKKISRLPTKDTDKETVALKPFEIPAKPEIEKEKDKEEEPLASKKIEIPQKDEAVKESVSAPKKSEAVLVKEREKEKEREPSAVKRPQKDEAVKEPVAAPKKAEAVLVSKREKEEKREPLAIKKSQKEEAIKEPVTAPKKADAVLDKGRDKEGREPLALKKPLKDEAVKEPVAAPKKAEAVLDKERENDEEREPVALKRPQKDEMVKESFVTPKKTKEKNLADEKEPENVALEPIYKSPLDEKPAEVGRPSIKVKRLPTEEQKKEEIELKPFSKAPTAEVPTQKIPSESEDKEAITFKKADKVVKDKLLKEVSAQVKKTEVIPTHDKELEKITKTETPPAQKEKPLPSKAVPLKTDKVSPKDDEKTVPVKKTAHLLKGHEETDKEILLKHVEVSKPGLQLRKSPSPKVEKPVTVELTPAERRSSGDTSKILPKKVSPKDSIDSVTLKAIPKKTSPPEEKITDDTRLKTGIGKIPQRKEVSPESVQLRKIPTKQEEEVSNDEPEKQLEDEEESSGWELTPRESYGSSEDWEVTSQASEEGALETPGMKGDRRGERVTADPHH